MPDSLKAWTEKILTGDRRAIALAISAIENGEQAGVDLLKKLFPKAGRAYVLGLTGSPGVGKSTLVEKLAADYRANGTRVGIVAIDPTSPFSGGAILGDRIRMQSLAHDPGIYIRSMATRGQLGGLAPTTHDAVTVLDAAGYERVMIETVGVGQDEVDIARLADATALLVVPGMGDDVQAFKAGVMEIADLFVINKADRSGADRMEQEISTVLALAAREDGWRPPILKTVATTGEGVAALREAFEKFRAFSSEGKTKLRRQRERVRARLLELLRQSLFERVVADRLRNGWVDARVEDLLAHRRDPHSVVEELVAESVVGGRKIR